MRRRMRSHKVDGLFWPALIVAISIIIVIALGSLIPNPKQVDFALEHRVTALEGQISLLGAQMERFDSLMTYAERFQVSPTVSAIVLDAAWAVGLSPGLAFQLVEVESGFDSLAISRAGAQGLTQVMPKTRDSVCPGVNLFDPRANARCGFVYLLQLLDDADGNMHRALLMYNRGPGRVSYLEARGRDPDNGYPDLVCEGSCELYY